MTYIVGEDGNNCKLQPRNREKGKRTGVVTKLEYSIGLLLPPVITYRIKKMKIQMADVWQEDTKLKGRKIITLNSSFSINVQ